MAVREENLEEMHQIIKPDPSGSNTLRTIERTFLMCVDKFQFRIKWASNNEPYMKNRYLCVRLYRNLLNTCVYENILINSAGENE